MADAGKPELQVNRLSQGVLYSLTVTAGSGYRVKPVSSKLLTGVASPKWAEALGKKPVFVINGGFFDPKNQLTTSFIFENGQLTGDPRQNPSLMGNPDLKAYMPKILDRTEFRVYTCQDGKQFRTRYDIVSHESPIPKDCLMSSSVGAGPRLLPSMTDYDEGFTDYNAQKKRTRDPIGVCSRNARSAIGLTATGDVVILMGAQIPGRPAGTGFTLAEMADQLKARGAVQAISLDGGSSSGIVFDGKPYYGKFNKDLTPVKRPIKSVVVVVPN